MGEGTIYDLSTINNSVSGAPLNINDTNININDGNLILTTTNSYISTNNINMGGTGSDIIFSSILNIDSSAAAVDNGIINIGTAYNPTINFGSAGTSHTITMNGDLNIQREIDNNYTTLNLINISNVSSSVQFSMQTGGGSYSLYATDSEGSPAESGLIPSTFQIYSYYPTPTPVLTIYPNGNTNILGNLTVGGSAISRVAVSTVNSNPGAAWPNFYGKYCFVTLIGTPLNISGSPTDGTIVVIRNVTSDNSPITVNSNTILAGKTLSFVYTTTSGISAGWYSL
jgi:hypothetical protein